MNIVEAMRAYQLDYGVVTLSSPPQAEENPHLFTATYLNLLQELGIEDSQTNQQYKSFVDRCEIRRGLYNRYPNYVTRLVSHDEYIGICNIHPDKALDSYEYGVRQGWVFNNTENHDLATWAESWHWRLGIAVPYYKLRAGKKTSWLENLFLFGHLIAASSADATNTSGRCLIYLMKNTYQNHPSLLVRWGYKHFLKDLSNKYVTLSGLYSIYFGANHPLSIYSKDIKFT